MATSPLVDADGPIRVAVVSDGKAVGPAAGLISVTVRHAINSVPKASLIFADGNMADQAFPLSDGSDFKPGAEIRLKAGYGDNETQIFGGIVTRQSLRITGDDGAHLGVECCDKALKMTVGRKSAQYVDKTDADVISALIRAHGLSAKVSDATLMHAELVQHYCTDWAFMLMRAQANGCVVMVQDGVVTAAPPDTSGSAALKVTYGDDLIEFHADLDAVHQYGKVQASAWSIEEQSLVLSEDQSPARLNTQGNLDSSSLAGVIGLDRFSLQSGAPLPKATLDVWAKAQQLKSGLSRLRGRMLIQGSPLAQVGTLVEVAGVGGRFSGAAFVTGVTHEIKDGNWTTEVEFGSPAEWLADCGDVVAPGAAGLVPAIEGLHAGVVLKLEGDPSGEHRVQVRAPSAGGGAVWARLLQFHASSACGAFFVPEVGDEVLLGWFNNDPGFAVVLGSLYSGRHPPPTSLSAANDIKAIVTRSKTRLEFNDQDRAITLQTPGNCRMVFSDREKSIVITDPHDNKVELGAEGITLDSPKDITINAKGSITMDATGAVRIGSKSELTVEGLNVSCSAQSAMVVKGSATAELSASGQTTVKGAMVLIN